VRVPLSWLREFAPLEGDASALAETLDDLGLVVEEIVHVGEGLDDVVVARVEEIAAIPGADRIRRVVVDAGTGPVEVVCGAWNFAEGDLVPLAPVGAVLPGGFEIARRKMKGVESNGMLCSPSELALSDDHRGILVLGSAADGGPSPGTALAEALGIERDVVFDLAVEANRPDAWSVAGVARDLAARLQVPFVIPDPPEAAVEAPGAGDRAATVEVVDLDLCPRFTARVLQGVTVGTSPRWLARRLTLAGMRPLNSVVDASNYVMLELGQPTHPYDLDRLAGNGLRVRAARPGEPVVTLDGVERRMAERAVGVGDDRRDCLICDGADHPVGIGGIMGGRGTEIDASTATVLLEAAYFTPMAIARTSKRLGLRTEASARFERGCDPEGIDRAACRFVELLGHSAGAGRQVGDVVDVRGDVPRPARVVVRTTRVNALLGTDLDARAVTALLEPIGFACEDRGDGTVAVTVPTFRPDTDREVDVVEEVARHFGYSRIARHRPHAPQVGALTGYQRQRRFVREVLAGIGAHEVWTASLLAPGDHERTGRQAGITVANPLVDDESVLRRSLLPGMLGALAANAARRQGELRLFEIGHVFPPPDPGRVDEALSGRRLAVVDEREMLGVLLAWAGDDALDASATWSLVEEALGVVGVGLDEMPSGEADETLAGLHPTRRARLVGGAGAFGVVGEVDPAVLEAFGLEAFGVDGAGRRVGFVELDLEVLLTAVERRSPFVRELSRFPSADVDLAFVVADDVASADVADTLRRAGGELLEWVRLFDVYRGEGLPAGTRSLAYRLRFLAPDRTLDERELQGLRTRCIEQVTQDHGGVLRA
jgi:phenylalanyl-tRNA synthetase beta chain